MRVRPACSPTPLGTEGGPVHVLTTAGKALQLIARETDTLDWLGRVVADFAEVPASRVRLVRNDGHRLDEQHKEEEPRGVR